MAWGPETAEERDMPLTVTCPGCRASLHVREEGAGQSMLCPRCGGTVAVPDEEPLTVLPAADEGTPRARPEAGGLTKLCPACHREIPRQARKCRYCRDWVEEDDEDAPIRYKPCPRCGATGAERVLFTFWGSFYGPALFSHVRCPDCGYAYNGRTGRSNLVPAVVFVTVPLVLILAIIGGLIALLVATMH
jgi:hypothetical protein